MCYRIVHILYKRSASQYLWHCRGKWMKSGQTLLWNRRTPYIPCNAASTPKYHSVVEEIRRILPPERLHVVTESLKLSSKVICGLKNKIPQVLCLKMDQMRSSRPHAFSGIDETRHVWSQNTNSQSRGTENLRSPFPGRSYVFADSLTPSITARCGSKTSISKVRSAPENGRILVIALVIIALSDPAPRAPLRPLSVPHRLLSCKVMHQTS